MPIKADWREIYPPRIVLFADQEDFFVQLADEFLRLVIKVLAVKDTFRVVMGGGRTPRILNDKIVALAQRAGVNWERVTIYLTDERCVPPEHPDSNYRMLYETLLSPLGIADRCVRIKGELPVEVAAQHYERELHCSLDKVSPPFFDLALLGMGEDGHTASLFPDRASLSELQRLVIPVGIGPDGHQRVSLTYASLNGCKNVWFLIFGKEKQSALDCLLSDCFNPCQCPASGVCPRGGGLVYFIGPGLQTMKSGRIDQRQLYFRPWEK